MTDLELAAKLPKHINLSIEHQPHTVSYETVEEWLTFREVDCADEDRRAMIEAGEVWEVHWYPDTPVDSYMVAAATLQRALELAEAQR